MKSHSQATFTTALVLVVVFGSGALVGAAVDGLRGGEDPEEQVREDGEGEQERRRTPMYEQVGISDEQRVVIDSIMVANRTKVRAERAEYDSAYRAIVEETRAAILSVMNPEQQVQYDSLLAESDARRAAREQEERGGNRE
ncbi:MAG TPA: hypothetical protein VK858_02715 [Longimicrobiales bacterium]|nr:hypothetical protein [Longimicrobiales bacterium]